MANPDLSSIYRLLTPIQGVSANPSRSFGSYLLGARGRVLSLPAGGGWRRCHSAPLVDRTPSFATPTARPGDGEHQSFPPPAGPSRWPGKATSHFSCYPYKDIGRGYTAYLTRGPGGPL